MEEKNKHLSNFILCIELEEKEQIKRYQLDEQHSLKSLKSEGLAIHPIRISRKSFGYAEYPEIGFRIGFPMETSNFRDGMAIECFCQGEESVKGLLLTFDGRQGEFRLFAPDFPDWLEDDGVGIKLTPDTRTTAIMKKALLEIPSNPRLNSLFATIHGETHFQLSTKKVAQLKIDFQNKYLNESQQMAVEGMLSDQYMMIIHGPPGTGKTTTLLEGIVQLSKSGEKLLVSAPSNAAVDNIAKGLIDKNIKFLRIGNNTKVDANIFPFTPEGKLIESKQDKEIKKLRIRADEMRKMANQYKRRFGKDERDQRNLLIKEVKNIRHEIKALQQYNEEKLFSEAQVILGTPIGLMDPQLKKLEFNTLIIDEAGQCLEPLAWCIFDLADKIILAGDPLQLPPTVLSDKAAHLGLNKSILENCFGKFEQIFLLDTQYRMRESIAQFSNEYFYDGKLKTPPQLANLRSHVTFFDTAGTGFDEEGGKDGSSLMNKGEIDIVLKIMEQDKLNPSKCAFISPYAGQIALAKESLPKGMRISTIDSFQGQEMETIIISTVRSNPEKQIGFLKDHRRMNVAMTRAIENLYIIGDSTTLINDPYFEKMFLYFDRIEAYKTAWEIMYS